MNFSQNFLPLSTDVSDPFVIPNVSPISLTGIAATDVSIPIPEDGKSQHL